MMLREAGRHMPARFSFSEYSQTEFSQAQPVQSTNIQPQDPVVQSLPNIPASQILRP